MSGSLATDFLKGDRTSSGQVIPPLATPPTVIAIGEERDETITRGRGPIHIPGGERATALGGEALTTSPRTTRGRPDVGVGSRANKTTTSGDVRPPTSSGWVDGADGLENRPNLDARPVESNGRMEENIKKAAQAARVASPAGPRDNLPAQGSRPDQPDHRHVIAIDGAAAAGKTTVARELAARLKVTLFDTGVLYRAVTLAALEQSIPLEAADRLADLAANLDIRVGRPTTNDGRLYDVTADGVDVTWAIRGAGVDQHVSQVSAHGAVREALLPVQRAIADGASVVMVGRDIGTVVTPTAGVKIFLSATLEERARRRHAELRSRGERVDLEFIIADLARRDAIDSARDVSPLKAAADAIPVDTDGRTIEEIVAEIECIVRSTWSTFA